MLSIKHNFLFLHIPKTAGNSIQSALLPFSCEYKVLTAPFHEGHERFELRNDVYHTQKHSTLVDYAEILPEQMFRNIKKISILRNTFERVVSHYFSPSGGRQVWDERKFCAFVNERVKPLRHYIGLPGQNLDAAVMNLDYLLRFEKLEADFSSMCEDLRLNVQQLAHLNRSVRLDVWHYYNDSLITFVYERFQEEIDFFSFKPFVPPLPTPPPQEGREGVRSVV